jgi:hypothetical protein
VVEKRLHVQSQHKEGLQQRGLQISIPTPSPISVLPMAEVAVAIRPPTFSGKADEDADSFMNSFDRYIRYREIKDADKKLNLLVVLFTGAARD